MTSTSCKLCGKQFHYCPNCGYYLEYDLFPLTKGFCSWKCMNIVDPTQWTYYRKECKIEQESWEKHSIHRQSVINQQYKNRRYPKSIKNKGKK